MAGYRKRNGKWEVRIDQKNDFKKKIIYFSLIISAFLLTGIITLI